MIDDNVEEEENVAKDNLSKKRREEKVKKAGKQTSSISAANAT